jgi:hypothetical protein
LIEPGETKRKANLQALKPASSSAKKCTTFAKGSMARPTRNRLSPSGFRKRPAQAWNSASERTRKQARRDTQKGQQGNRRPSRTRSRAVSKILKQGGHSAASPENLSWQAKRAARRRGSAARKVSARRAVRTKGPSDLRRSARKAGSSRRRNS